MPSPSVSPRCSFCAKPRSQVKKLVSGPNVFICDKCIAECDALLDQGTEKEASYKKLPPARMVQLLDEYVVGQDRAKRILAVALYNHLKRLHYLSTTRKPEVELQKGNILLVGPTGSGKTHLVRNLARIIAKECALPFVEYDATSLTQAGYVGEDVENILAKLFRSMPGLRIDQAVARAECAIVYIDEIDKLAKRAGRERDVGGEGVQQSLLKLVEGTVASIRPSGPNGPTVQIRTHNLLFIVGGAFVGLDQITNRRLEKRRLGFGSSSDDPALGTVAATPSTEDFHKFGMIPEFMGRFPVVAPLDPLSEEAMAKIITEPRDAILRQYQALFRQSGAALTATPSAILALARKALAQGTGARGLRRVMEEILLETMFHLERGMHYELDDATVELSGDRLLPAKQIAA